jgi:hypothetical protein
LGGGGRCLVVEAEWLIPVARRAAACVLRSLPEGLRGSARDDMRQDAYVAAVRLAREFRGEGDVQGYVFVGCCRELRGLLYRSNAYRFRYGVRVGLEGWQAEAPAPPGADALTGAVAAEMLARANPRQEQLIRAWLWEGKTEAIVYQTGASFAGNEGQPWLRTAFAQQIPGVTGNKIGGKP